MMFQRGPGEGYSAAKQEALALNPRLRGKRCTVPGMGSFHRVYDGERKVGEGTLARDAWANALAAMTHPSTPIVEDGVIERVEEVLDRSEGVESMSALVRCDDLRAILAALAASDRDLLVTRVAKMDDVLKQAREAIEAERLTMVECATMPPAHDLATLDAETKPYVEALDRLLAKINAALTPVATPVVEEGAIQ
jgi:hypothetical protein